MKYIITLEAASRYAQSNFGKFRYMAEHQRLVWRGEEISNIATLAETVNEAGKFLRSYTGPLSYMRVEEIEARSQEPEERKEASGAEVTGGTPVPSEEAPAAPRHRKTRKDTDGNPDI